MRFFLLFSLLFFCCACKPGPQPRLATVDYVPASKIEVAGLRENIEKANMGDPAAQYEVGRHCLDGMGMERDRKQAARWWRRSAESGYAPAQYALGMMYFAGQDIMLDFVEGCRWLGLAGRQGYAPAVAQYGRRCADSRQ